MNTPSRPKHDTDIFDCLLLDRIAGGDRDALADLYHCYHGRLCDFLSRITRRSEIVDEIINECFWVVWQKSGDFRHASLVSTWIFGIAYRTGLKAVRRHSADPIDSGTLSQERFPSVDPSEDRELRDWLAKGLNQLKPEQRLVVELVYGLGHSLDEVATVVGAPIGTVKARLSRARQSLRDVLPILADEVA